MADEATTSQAVTDSNNSVATTTLVVGEHSVYKSVEDLIEGKRKADEYIAKLSSELKEAGGSSVSLAMNFSHSPPVSSAYFSKFTVSRMTFCQGDFSDSIICRRRKSFSALRKASFRAISSFVSS